jgi:hypothetical protein
MSIRIDTAVPFPSLVQGALPITVTKVSGVWTIGWSPTNTGVLFVNQPDQVLTGGANVVSLSLPAGNVTIDCGARPLQFIPNNAAFSITAPVNDGTCMLLVTNGATAGAITFIGFSEGPTTGDPLTTVNGSKFTISIWRINGTAGYRVAAHQ